jgi:hypothetical protein
MPKLLITVGSATGAPGEMGAADRDKSYDQPSWKQSGETPSLAGLRVQNNRRF